MKLELFQCLLIKAVQTLPSETQKEIAQELQSKPLQVSFTINQREINLRAISQLVESDLCQVLKKEVRTQVDTLLRNQIAGITEMLNNIHHIVMDQYDLVESGVLIQEEEDLEPIALDDV